MIPPVESDASELARAHVQESTSSEPSILDQTPCSKVDESNESKPNQDDRMLSSDQISTARSDQLSNTSSDGCEIADSLTTSVSNVEVSAVTAEQHSIESQLSSDNGIQATRPNENIQNSINDLIMDPPLSNTNDLVSLVTDEPAVDSNTTSPTRNTNDLRLADSTTETCSSSSDTSSNDILELKGTPLTSSTPSEYGTIKPIPMADIFASGIPSPSLVPELFSENIIAKAIRTAQCALNALPAAFPELVPHEAGHDGSYSLREADFWTCGFFPGELFLLLERLIRYPHSVELPSSISLLQLREQLATLCQAWAQPIRGMDGRTDTHDIGFIIMPALRLDWELFGNYRSLNSIVKAAHSLATRYVPDARAIRSWDLLKKKDIEILDQEENMIVIIDSMCNLDLLFYASHHTQDPSLAEMAHAHAETLLRSHLRPEPVMSASQDAYHGQWYSTCHVANLDPRTGNLHTRLTAQGYQDDSTWSRGQAWGIFGYAETYKWTRDRRFLDASCGLAEYFLYRLETAPEYVTTGRYVPLWDFDAPIEDKDCPLRDSSAGAIAANGMLILSQSLAMVGEATLSARFRGAAMRIVQDTLEFALAPEKAQLVAGAYQHISAEETVTGKRYDGLLKYGTANNNVNARKRYANHGLVYGDYYLVEFGNRLLRMGMY